ncbi:MAG: aminopeptidase, partial [Verrucomicrobia bacterium]
MRRVWALFIFTAVTSLKAEKPFEFPTTPGKLPKHIRPIEYAIRIQPDLAKLTFSGSETVQLSVESPTRQIVFNAFDVSVTEARIDENLIASSAVKADTKNELVTLSLPEELQHGQHTLALKFNGKINQFGRGLYYVKYQEQGTGAKKLLLGTQFEATD